ncbi:MAG TPA: shikimate dehydrogenase [Deltaproteobacteria bacterium]|jgi:shikimate dehydrogenase|nr:shikimate dehydrogenase [Deltaproteobacteria bacterium]
MIRPEQKKLFAVIGNPVRHSLSPVMMNACFKALDVPALYAAFYVDELDSDLKLLHKTGFSGLSVTIPYKEMACRLAEQIDKTAQKIGAANTLRRTSLGWEGLNTDWIGALRALSAVVEVSARNALILGAGGAARSVAYGLIKAGAKVTISNRCVERGKVLSRQIKSNFIPLNTLAKVVTDFDIVVQCTSVGLEDSEASPIVFDSFFKPEMTVMDIIYNPRWTAFSRAARDAGCMVVSGLDMLLYQGAAQLEWWLGRAVFETPAIEAMRQALEEAINEKAS